MPHSRSARSRIRTLCDMRAHGISRYFGLGALLVALTALTFFAATEVWRDEVPAVRARITRAPVTAVMTPVMFYRHRASSRRSAQKTQLLSCGIRKRSGVQLTKKQASFVQRFGQFLRAHGESAIVTSGARTPMHQLAIIKSKIRSLGAAARFPALRRATPSKPSTWLSAWEFLRARHVPVNAPASVPGEYVETSNHLKGLAVDLISGSLDHLRSMVAAFSNSTFATKAALRVTTIAREPGCVHVNLTPNIGFASRQ